MSQGFCFYSTPDPEDSSFFIIGYYRQPDTLGSYFWLSEDISSLGMTQMASTEDEKKIACVFIPFAASSY